jgi:hypothetical protein
MCVEQIHQPAVWAFNNVIETQCFKQEFFGEQNRSLAQFYLLLK